jgi:hypothetical protein
LPILRARLGEAWIHTDPVIAQQWMLKAVEAVEKEPPQETADNRKERLDTARIVLKIVMPIDHRLGDRVFKILPTSVSPEGQADAAAVAPADRLKETQDLTEAVQSVVQDDPAQAAQLGKLFLALRGGSNISTLLGSLRTRSANQMGGLFSSLRQADQRAADQLFMEAVASVRKDYDYTILFALSEIAFPTIANPSQATLPVELQEALLQVIAEGILRVPSSPQEQLQICQIAPLAARLQGAYGPGESGAIQVAIQACQGNSGNDELQDSLHDLHNSADYLSAADSEPEVNRRVRYKSKAAWKAQQEEGNPRLALEIWDGLTREERDAYPTWAADRDHAAEAAIAELYRLHNPTEIDAVLARTPDRQRAKLQLQTTAMLFAQQDKSLGLSLLAEARHTLELHDVDDASVYLMLLTTYAAVLPGEVPEVFKLVVTGMNHIAPKPADARLWVLPAGYDLRPYQFGPTMLDLDSSVVELSVEALESREQRVGFRLGLLRATLKRYEADAATAPKPTKLAKSTVR